MILNIIIIFNMMLIMATLTFYIRNFKNKKKYLYQIISLIATLVFQTGIVAGLILKQNASGMAIIAEVLYLFYFVYKINIVYGVSSKGNVV